MSNRIRNIAARIMSKVSDMEEKVGEVQIKIISPTMTKVYPHWDVISESSRKGWGHRRRAFQKICLEATSVRQAVDIFISHIKEAGEEGYRIGLEADRNNQ